MLFRSQGSTLVHLRHDGRDVVLPFDAETAMPEGWQGRTLVPWPNRIKGSAYFLRLGKQGSTLSGVMDAFSIAISIALQYGVPLETYVQKFTNLKFEPAGMTDDPDIRIAQSIMDYIFRRLALDYLSYDERSELGIEDRKSVV